jgi:hypothetical protein
MGGDVVRRTHLLLPLFLSALSGACADGATRNASPDSGLAAGGGSGWYTQCLCEVDTQAYLDLSFVELADTVTGTITTRQDSVILRLDGVHWAPSKTFPFPMTEGSTISIYMGLGGRTDLSAEFAPWWSTARMGRLFASPFAVDSLATIGPEDRFFGVLYRPSGTGYYLRLNSVRASDEPHCEPWGRGVPHQPEVQVTRAELITILQSHARWQDAWAPCVRKLEETGGWSGAVRDPPPTDAGP